VYEPNQGAKLLAVFEGIAAELLLEASDGRYGILEGIFPRFKTSRVRRLRGHCALMLF